MPESCHAMFMVPPPINETPAAGDMNLTFGRANRAKTVSRERCKAHGWGGHWAASMDVVRSDSAIQCRE
jgi:hypothetical protein